MTNTPISSPDAKTPTHVPTAGIRSVPGSPMHPGLSNRACVEQNALQKDPIR